MNYIYTALRYGLINVINRAELGIRKHHVGKQFTSYGRIFIRGRGCIFIGDRVTITSCRETNPIGGDSKTILYTKGNGCIRIGNHAGISNTAIVALGSIEIEDDVLIGGNCRIYDHDFHALDFETRNKPGNQGVEAKPVRIKKGAFVGAHSIILKGVTIGEKSIIGAGSVVAKDVPDGEIWAGNPANFIRKIDC